MYQYNESAFLKFPIIFMASLLFVIPAISCRIINHHFRYPRSIKIEKFMLKNMNPWFMKFNRLQGEDYKLGKSTAFLTESRHQRNFFKIKSRYNTSCGEITCDHPENYPEELIKKLYIKKLGIKNSTSQIGERSVGDDPIMYFPDSLPETKHLSKRDCNTMTAETRPREALDLNGQPVYVVNIRGIIEVKGEMCTAPKYCQDSRTPEGYWNHCETRLEYVSADVFDEKNKTIEKLTIQIARGCTCVLEKKRKDEIIY